MDNAEFPGLYRSSDTLSYESQRHFFGMLLLNLLLLVLAGILSVVNSEAWQAALLQALVLLGALACSVYLAAKRPDRVWYGARAVAESVKTVTWRYICKAEPFDHFDTTDRAMFLTRLSKIVDQNRAVSEALTDHLDQNQITASMSGARSDNLTARMKRYKQFRIDDQLGWYSEKARANRKNARTFFGFLITVNALAICFALAKIKFPNTSYWPTDGFIALAACILTWLQGKRFTELAASYALTAHEINLIRESAASITTELEFSQFVGDAENAFSREHTQWVARLDK